MMLKFGKKINVVFTLVISIACIILFYIPTGFENPDLIKYTLRDKAEILSVNNDDIGFKGLIATGTQIVEMKILSGDFRGDTIAGKNILMGRLKIDKIFKKGDLVLCILKTDSERKKLLSARAEDLYRINVELILFGLFALFLIGFAKWTGFKALLSFVFTGLAIWKVLIPMFLRGYNPLFVSFIIVSVTTAIIILLISGLNRKGLVALAGSISGIALTTFMSIVFGHYFRIPGTVMEYAESLLYTGLRLDLTSIFLSGIFISAAGAVMDVAMDIAASQNELVSKKPEIGKKELILSGFNVARPVIGTMTTTLLFAYSGSFTFMLMVFMAKGTPMNYIFNTNFIAAEILYTLVGSFGLVLVAPITAIIGGYFYSNFSDD